MGDQIHRYPLKSDGLAIYSHPRVRLNMHLFLTRSRRYTFPTATSNRWANTNFGNMALLSLTGRNMVESMSIVELITLMDG